VIAGTLEVQLLANVARLQQDMTQAKGMVQSTMREIQSAARVAMTALGALGATLSVAYFANLIKGAIEAQARMKDLAQESGTTASAISRFEQPARLAGLSTEAVAGAIFKMSKAAQEAKDPMSNAGQALKAIGISTNELKGMKPDEMFEKVARQLDKYGDGLAKNNIMQELFGKSGREMARVVKEVAEAQQLHASVTDEEAEAADRLQDQIELARIESEKFWRSLAADGVPTFYAMVKAFNEGKKEAGLYEAAIRALGAAFSEGFLGMFGDPEKKRVAALSEEISDLEKKIAEGGKVLGVGVTDRSMIGGYIARVTQLKAELAGLQSFLDTQKRTSAKPEEAKPPIAFDPEAARKAAEEIKRLRELDAKGWVAYVEARSAEYEEGLRADGRALDEWRANEAKALKLSDAEWVKYIDATIEEYERGLKTVGAMQPSYMEAMQKQWSGFLDGIEGAFRAGWDAFGSGAKNAAQIARDALKRTLYDWLWQSMAKPFILNIVAQGANAMGISGLGSAATAAAGGASALGGLGSIASAAGSFIGGPELLAGSATLLEAAGPMLSMVGAAMPYIAAAIAIYSMFAKQGGGPKDGGSYFGQFTSLGDYLGQGRVPGTDNGRFFTPSGQDSAVAGVGAGAAAQYYASARALGLKTGAFSFGLGYDTDPNGTAPNRVSSGLVDASGRTIYGARDRDIGRDSSAITPALQLEASRMVAAAIKASELPAYLRKVFDGLTVDTATQQQIDDALNTATALKTIFDVLGRNPMEDVATAIEASQNQYETALKANAKAIREAIDQFDGTTASTQKLAGATTQYYNAQLQLMAAIAQVSQQINSMFDETFRNIKLAGMDNQGKYNFYQQDAEEARKLIATSTDPEVIRQLTTRINQNINSAFGLLSPEEQRAMASQFITQGMQAQTEANNRLEQIQADAAAATKTTLEEIKTLLGMNAEDFKQAGADIKAGGNAILDAADRGVTVRIVDSRGNAIVNGG
jgi:hypothetical protein